MPKLLVCVPDSSNTLGVGRVYNGASEALRRRGWTVDYVTPSDLGTDTCTTIDEAYRLALRERLKSVAAAYDFVEYDYSCLPFPREEFSPQTVLIAKSVLLHYHLEEFRMPTLASRPRRLISYIRKHLPGSRKPFSMEDHLERSRLTLNAADLISVASPRDQKKLCSLGFPHEKISVLPYGLDHEDFGTLSRIPSHTGNPPRAVFLGSFDVRKGAVELPKIFANLRHKHPHLRLRLLGTAGLYKTASEVEAFFPRNLRSSLEIFPRFERSELPKLLTDCSIGIFPSYLESFGFSVVEILAAGIPVIAYDVPGPGDLLPADWLAPRGDWQALAHRAGQVLDHSDRQASSSARAREQASPWTWDKAALLTENAYFAAKNKLQKN